MKYLIVGINKNQRKLITENTYGAIDVSHPSELDAILTENSLENYTIVYVANDDSLNDKDYTAFEKKLDDIKEFPLCVTSITTLPLDTDLEKQAVALNERYVLHNATVDMLRECAEYGIIKIEKNKDKEEIFVSHELENGRTKEVRYLLDRFTDTLLSPAQNRDFALLTQQLLYAKKNKSDRDIKRKMGENNRITPNNRELIVMKEHKCERITKQKDANIIIKKYGIKLKQELEITQVKGWYWTNYTYNMNEIAFCPYCGIELI